MKKHMGKRILAIALAAVMMSSVVDYSCMIEVRAEEINTESAETTGESNESAETTRESNEATETTDAASESDVTETEPAAEPTDEITVVEEQKATPAVSSEVTLSEETQTGESQTEEPQLEEPQLEEPQTEEPVENVEEISEQEDAEKETKEQTQMAEGTVEIDPEILEQLPNNDELFAGHVEQVLYGNNEVALYSNYGESRLTEVDLAVYRCMKRRIEEIAEGKTSSTVLKIPYSELEQEGGAYSKLSYVRMYRVLEALLRDNPYSMYWFDTTSSFAYNCYGISRSFEVYLPVSADYAGSAEYTTDSTKLGRVKTAADNARKIVSEASKLDDYHKLLTYKNKICEYTSYNFFAATDENTKYGDPWQLIYVFDGDEATKVVCEGYAKAFQYLCDLSTFQNDIVCYTLTGGMNGEGHMWNIVHMDDGKNYLVDVTNCDDRSEEYFVIPFLIGTDTGSPETGYTYHLWNDITYTYDNSNRLYDDSVLKIAENKYVYGWQDNQPTTPTEPTNPTEPSQPITPSEPTTPSQPTTPSEPTIPSQPTTPTEPSAPTTPEQPSAPATPTRPEQPSEEPEVEPDTLNVTVGNIKVQSYTGKGITPKITVKDPATRKKLKQGKHYTVSYENNVNVGTAAIVIRGIEANGYSGVKHVYFTIQPQTVAKKMKASAAGKKFLYTGYELTPGVNLTYNKMKLTEGVDYVVSYSNNVEKGTAKIFIIGIGNYTGSRTVKFKITGPKLKDAQVSLVENGTAYPDITVTYAGRTLAEGQDYTVKYPKVVKPGNNRIIVKGRGSFSGSVKLTYYVEGL